MAKKIIVANWKMNPPSLEEAKKITSSSIKKVPRGIDLILCPPSIFLIPLVPYIKNSKVFLGAQNFFYEEKGAYTGEISTKMGAALGITHTIAGHSERRKMGETDEEISKKVAAALKEKIIPIICVGEKERDVHGNYLQILKTQLETALSLVSKTAIKKIIIAYEPVWAIGKEAKDAMSPDMIHETVILIRKIIVDKFGTGGRGVPILYGGSVAPENTKDIVQRGEVDGLLVGHQSLLPESFSKIMEETSKA